MDYGRKWTFLSWCNDKRSFASDDCIEFDFIPFGFSKNLSNGRHMFINDNFSVDTLISANNFLNTSSSATIALSTYLKTIALNNLRYNIQVISKSKESKYQNIYISPATLDVFDAMSKIPNISNLEHFKFQDVAGRWFSYETILDYLIAGKNLDEIIVSVFKLKSDDFAKKQELLHLVILVNDIFYRGGKNLMNEKIAKAKSTGFAVANKLEENKVNAYRNKLTSYVATNNKKMVFDLLIQLQNYSDVTIPFFFCLVEDYDENVNLLYAFIAAVKKYSKKDEEEI
jgi:CRISPR-associated protein Cst1